MQDILLVSLGAVLGANLRFIIYKKLKTCKSIKYFRILIINTFSSFFLGLFISLMPQISSLNYSYTLVLFILIGFLGSLSTFSTFVYELFEMFRQLYFFRALKLLMISLSLGIIALALGLFLGN
ncbi:fluoride efflux transporter FluC [Prochlorococcus marinus]|uniref:fluoride efflux transporter FluC n=1 Tax=Prochlorococcus marinus TaxID=1219 RepID=UPI0022B3A14B|nr:CrcB family protein [Prochlorococcus marinus]